MKEQITRLEYDPDNVSQEDLKKIFSAASSQKFGWEGIFDIRSRRKIRALRLSGDIRYHGLGPEEDLSQYKPGIFLDSDGKTYLEDLTARRVEYETVRKEGIDRNTEKIEELKKKVKNILNVNWVEPKNVTLVSSILEGLDSKYDDLTATTKGNSATIQHSYWVNHLPFELFGNMLQNKDTNFKRQFIQNVMLYAHMDPCKGYFGRHSNDY